MTICSRFIVYDICGIQLYNKKFSNIYEYKPIYICIFIHLPTHFYEYIYEYIYLHSAGRRSLPAHIYEYIYEYKPIYIFAFCGVRTHASLRYWILRPTPWTTRPRMQVQIGVRRTEICRTFQVASRMEML